MSSICCSANVARLCAGRRDRRGESPAAVAAATPDAPAAQQQAAPAPGVKHAEPTDDVEVTTEVLRSGARALAFTDPCQVALTVCTDASEDGPAEAEALKMAGAAAGKVSMGTAKAAEELLAGGGGNGMSASARAPI